jgi:hypothetical protein
MRALLDTNIVIHRETHKVVSDDIGRLFYWLDKLGYAKTVHPFTVDEINQYKNQDVVDTFNIKLESYHILKTVATDTIAIKQLRETDKTKNDSIDTSLLNELASNRIDMLITEDRGIHRKAKVLHLHDNVFTIDSFLEKVFSENPELVDYIVLSVKKSFFGNINVKDSFFNSLRDDYEGFNEWFNRKSDEIAYVCYAKREGGIDKVVAFLYVKVEDTNENYSDIQPQFASKRRLKIGTFKVVSNGFKLGERFLKIIFDNALQYKVDEIYVTIFDNNENQKRLIALLEDWGFVKHGIKLSNDELVFIKDFKPVPNRQNAKFTYPFIGNDRRYFIVPIYPEYHTELLPDSILNTETPNDFSESKPHRNAIKKVYISRSFFRDLIEGDIIVFYRTGGLYKGVTTTIGIVESAIHDIENEKQFIKLCRKRSVFDDDKLKKFWYYSPNRPFIVNFLYLYSFPKRLNMKSLIDLGIIHDVQSAPRGFEQITKEQFEIIMRESKTNESFIIH